MGWNAWLRRLPAALFVALVSSAAAAIPAAAAGTGLDPIVPFGESPNGHHIWDLYVGISFPALFIFFLIEGLLLAIIIKFRRSKLPRDYRPPQWHSNHLLEVVWTLVPFLILVGIGAASFYYLQKDYTPAAYQSADMEITVVAHQFGWRFQYPEGFTVNSDGLQATPMVIPTGKLVRLRLQSTDVIHGFWVPELMGKTDAVPGYDNFTWIKVDHPGKWRGQCTELCGEGHYSMQLLVQAVSPDDYQAWVQEQLSKAKASPSPSPTPSSTPSPAASLSPSPSVRPSAPASASPTVGPSPSPTR